MPTLKPNVSNSVSKPSVKKPAAPTTDRPAAKKAVTKPAVPKKTLTAPSNAADSTGKTKAKLVRDSFTMPKSEYVVIDALKQRLATLAHPAKKSELLRAGIKVLHALSDKALLAALMAVPTIKTGRPHKS